MVNGRQNVYGGSRGRAGAGKRNLGKILCRNIFCLIMSQCELGLEPLFWGDGEAGETTAPVIVASAEVAATVKALIVWETACQASSLMMCGA
jgi:hypothetical protein